MYFTALPADHRCDVCVRDGIHEEVKQRAIEKARDLIEQLAGIEGPQIKQTPKIATIAAEIVLHFGSEKDFVAAAMQDFRKARENRPGSPGVMQNWVSFMKIIAEANKHDREDELANMTLEQVRQEQKRLAFEMFLKAMADETKSAILMQFLETVGVQKSEVVPTLIP